MLFNVINVIFNMLLYYLKYFGIYIKNKIYISWVTDTMQVSSEVLTYEQLKKTSNIRLLMLWNE